MPLPEPWDGEQTPKESEPNVDNPEPAVLGNLLEIAKAKIDAWKEREVTYPSVQAIEHLKIWQCLEVVLNTLAKTADKASGQPNLVERAESCRLAYLKAKEQTEAARKAWREADRALPQIEAVPESEAEDE